MTYVHHLQLYQQLPHNIVVYMYGLMCGPIYVVRSSGSSSCEVLCAPTPHCWSHQLCDKQAVCVPVSTLLAHLIPYQDTIYHERSTGLCVWSQLLSLLSLQLTGVDSPFLLHPPPSGRGLKLIRDQESFNQAVDLLCRSH